MVLGVKIFNGFDKYQMLEWLFGKKKEQQPQKPSKQQDKEDKWKYDFIVQFLSGPLWKTSILDFVDYHCVVFDNEDENKFQYTTIHNKFKELVASLFDGMMQEVGLDDEKLAELLERGFTSKHKKIFEQLLLADDFLRFKQLMVKRNKQLESQAIKALNEEKVPKHQEPAQSVRQNKRISEQDILRESAIAEERRLKKIAEQEEEQLRKVLQMSKIEAQEQQMIKKLEEKVEEKQIKEVKPEVKTEVKAEIKAEPEPQQSTTAQSSQPAFVPASESSSVVRKKNLAPLQALPPLHHHHRKVQEPPKQQAEVPPVVEPVRETNTSEQKPAEQKSAELDKSNIQSQEQRKKRLLEQRERIRRKKEQQRRKQMAQEENKGVQTIVLQDDGIHETHLGVEPEEKKVPNSELERRRELMKKIKNRIIDDL